jgi:hypothetical protein
MKIMSISTIKVKVESRSSQKKKELKYPGILIEERISSNENTARVRMFKYWKM